MMFDDIRQDMMVYDDISLNFSNDDTLVTCLKDTDAQTLINAMLSGGGPGLEYLPTIEGTMFKGWFFLFFTI